MSETDFEAPASLLPEMQADVSTSDNDKALMDIWNKNNGPEAELKNPAMPEAFAKAEGDHFDAAAKWMQLPMKERRETAAVHREFADLKKQADALGMKTESAADIKAVQDMLAGNDKPQASAAVDKETQASLDTYKTIVPFAKDHVEARQHLSKLAEHVQRDPKGGSRAVLHHLGISTPLDLLTPQEWAQAREYLLGERAAPQQAEPAVAPYLDKWARSAGATKEDMAAMADIMSDPTWREIAGESDKSALDRAYKALQRTRTRNGANNRQRRLDDDMDRTLRGIAADIARP